MKKNYLTRNKNNIFFSFVLIIICYLLYKYGYINTLNKERTFHESLLTINSIFIGFLFTSLGMMVGFSSNKVVRSLEKGGYMDNYYNSIYFGIYFLIASTLISIYGVVVNNIKLNSLLIFFQQISLLIGILFFFKSIFGLLKIIKYIRNEN